MLRHALQRAAGESQATKVERVDILDDRFQRLDGEDGEAVDAARVLLLLFLSLLQRSIAYIASRCGGSRL